MTAYLARLEPAKLLIIAGVTIFFAASSLTATLLWPQVRAYLSAANSREAIQEAINSGGDLPSQLARSREQLSALNKRLYGEMANRPENEIEAYIIGQLQVISWRHQIELAGVKPSKGVPIDMFHEILFDVDVTGDYFDLYAWLRELNNELGFVVIKKYEMRPLDQHKEDSQLTAKLTIASYRSEQQ